MDLSVIHHLEVPVCLINSAGELVFKNRRYTRLFNIYGTNQISLDEEHEFYNDYRKRLAVSYSRALEGHDAKCFVVLKTSDSRQIFVELYLYPMTMQDATPGIFALFNEVEERVVSFDRTTTWLEEDDSIYQFSPFPLITITSDNQIIKISPSAEQLFSTDRQRLRDDTELFYASFSSYDAERLKSAIRDINNKDKTFVRLNELLIILPQGKKGYCNAHIYPLKKSGTINAAEIVFEDTTKIKNLENKLIKMNRVQILSDMTKGLLHSFNNMINIIINRTQMLLQLTEKKTITDGLQGISDTALEAANQIRRIQEFMVQDPAEAGDEISDIIELLDDSVEFASIHFKVENKEKRRNISINKQYFTKAIIKGNIKLLREIIVSMIFRVSSYIDMEGSILLDLKQEEDLIINVSVTKEDDDFNNSEQSEVFLPEIELRRIADRINVRIFEEESTERISLIAVIPQKMIETKPPKTDHIEKPKIRDCDILIIEDEPALNEILFELFDLMGNRVTIHENAETGLAEFKSHSYDIVISDYGLKGMTGIELLAKVKEINEKAVTVLLSGWVLEDINLYRKSVDLFLQKPFQIETLLQKIGEHLSRQS